MKITAVVLALLFTTLSSQAREGSDASDLAAGYANAFQCMSRTSVSVVYSNSGQPEIIKDIKEMKPFGGVLLVKAINGDQQILDASRIIKISTN
jgi:hypothetical protein